MDVVMKINSKDNSFFSTYVDLDVMSNKNSGTDVVLLMVELLVKQVVSTLKFQTAVMFVSTEKELEEEIEDLDQQLYHGTEIT